MLRRIHAHSRGADRKGRAPPMADTEKSPQVNIVISRGETRKKF